MKGGDESLILNVLFDVYLHLCECVRFITIHHIAVNLASFVSTPNSEYVAIGR